MRGLGRGARRQRDSDILVDSTFHLVLPLRGGMLCEENGFDGFDAAVPKEICDAAEPKDICDAARPEDVNHLEVGLSAADEEIESTNFLEIRLPGGIS